ncbi:MAG: hypothetical protein AAF549_08675 [Pseudomonadota bacterium]
MDSSVLETRQNLKDFEKEKVLELLRECCLEIEEDYGTDTSKYAAQKLKNYLLLQLRDHLPPQKPLEKKASFRLDDFRFVNNRAQQLNAYEILQDKLKKRVEEGLKSSVAITILMSLDKDGFDLNKPYERLTFSPNHKGTQKAVLRAIPEDMIDQARAAAMMRLKKQPIEFKPSPFLSSMGAFASTALVTTVSKVALSAAILPFTPAWVATATAGVLIGSSISIYKNRSEIKQEFEEASGFLSKANALISSVGLSLSGKQIFMNVAGATTGIAFINNFEDIVDSLKFDGIRPLGSEFRQIAGNLDLKTLVTNYIPSQSPRLSV